ncbi:MULTISPECIES: superoxide dismutase [Flavobacterium]|uniref:superoxide dismutase n=1 Tax=Flavobacterium TaxID=237 RepID=UPI002342DF82|nr:MULTISPECIES: superoxide dismutase [Flavobacterium]
MKTYKLALISFAFVALFSCRQKNKLEEVIQIPEPEAQETQSVYGNPAEVKAEKGKFKMRGLTYAYNALEPYIDGKTMEIHYSRHHLSYCNNLNKAIAGTDYEKWSLEDILKSSDPNNMAIRNNAGGYYNHNLYWEIMAPKAGGQPKDSLAAAINRDFGSYDTFKSQLVEAAGKQFGSGWAWLVVDKTGKLVVGSTPNQDNPLMPDMPVKGTPILALDVWEHAYYLKYQSRRGEYISAFFNVVNWTAVEKKYLEAMKRSIKQPVAPIQ